MSVESKLKSLVKIIIEEAKANPEFATLLEELLGEKPATDKAAKPKAKTKRNPAKFNPYTVYEDGLAALRQQLSNCEVNELKDIIAEFGLDPYGNAMSLRKREKLEQLVLDMVPLRAHKGSAFMEQN